MHWWIIKNKKYKNGLLGNYQEEGAILSYAMNCGAPDGRNKIEYNIILDYKDHHICKWYISAITNTKIPSSSLVY